MVRTQISLALAAVVLAAATAGLVAAQEKTVMVGGAAMFPSKDIIDNAVNSKDHTTLVAAVKAAGLVDTLKGPGPFTVFAPTNAAFDKLPKGTVETLLKPENKDMLTGDPDLPRGGRQARHGGAHGPGQDERRHGHAQDRQRRPALGDGQGQERDGEGRKGQRRESDDPPTSTSRTASSTSSTRC